LVLIYLGWLGVINMGFFTGFFNIFKPLTGSSRRPNVNENSYIVTLSEYWQGRDQAFPEDWSYEVKENARELLRRVNLLLAELNVVSVKVVSGWRPPAINRSVGGSPRSYHISGQAVDLRDNGNQEFAKLLINKSDLLRKYQLWLESPDHTRGNTNWIHLDMGIRPDKSIRVFNP
jgi:hypothetical protein